MISTANQIGLGLNVPVATRAPVQSAQPTYADLAIYRVMLVRDGSVQMDRQPVSNSVSAASVFRAYLQGADREHFVILMLDTKNQPIGLHTVSVGTLNSSLVTGANTFKPAILANAASIILCHNHPSGDPTPSPEDIALTRELEALGAELDITVLDHIIIGDDCPTVSLRERGLIGQKS